MRKKKTGTKKRMRTGKKTSGVGRKVPGKSISSFLPVMFFARFFEA